MPRSSARRRLLPIAVFLLLFLALAAWIGLRGLAAQRHLEAARDTLATAREALLDRDVSAAQVAITAAGRDTDRARALTSDPLWRLAAAVPVAGRSLEAAGGLAAAADDLARSVLPVALQGAEQIDPEALRLPDGSIDLAMLKSATPAVLESADRAEGVQADVVDLPQESLVPALADAREQLVDQVDELAGALRGSAQALELAPALLGEDQARRYLMLVQQTAESRGTGGLIGGYVVVEAEGGRLRVTDQGSNAELPQNSPVPRPEGVPEEWVEHYGHDGALEDWRNVNMSPDLPVVARVAEALWRERGGQPLDAVVTLDAVALELSLRSSGMLDLGDGKTLPPDELTEYLAVGQYREAESSGAGDRREQSAERKEKLDRVAAAAASRLVQGGGDTLSLLRGLGDAVRSGHLRMTSDEPAFQPTLAASGVDGGLPAGEAPVAYPVVFNSTGGKLDHFLDRRVEYTAGPCQGNRRRSTIAVELTNRAPAEGLPAYSTIRHTVNGLIDSTDNAVTLQVYGTRGAELVGASVDGEVAAPEDPDGPILYGTSEAGLPMWNLFVELPREQTRRIVLELDEPVVPGEPRVPEQPLSRPLEKDVDVPVCG